MEAETEMVKHTPGPWEVDYEETGVRWPTVIAPEEPGYDDGAPEEVCRISISYPIDADSDCPKRIEAEANARLIAAAPELLAACKAIICEGSHGNTVYGDSDHISLNDSVWMCQHAADKAEGRELMARPTDSWTEADRPR